MRRGLAAGRLDRLTASCGRRLVAGVAEHHRRARALPKATAQARPMPREPPVTSTTLSCEVHRCAHGPSASGRASAFSRLAGSSTLSTSMSLAMRFTRPPSTLPGPELHHPGHARPRERLARDSTQRTGALTCASSSGTIRAASALGAASTLVTTGTRGADTVHRASTSASRGFTGSISAQWKGADTGSGTTRLAPASLSFAAARSTAAAWPAMTVCSGEL